MPLFDIKNNLSGGETQLDQQLNKDEKFSHDQDGFILSPTPPTDGNSLPYRKVAYDLTSKPNRNTIHWYVPEVGIVKMYINPQSINYNFKKVINPERTKGGYTIQYWGEELPTLSIKGHTGSSGVEGLNVLYEVYRAEQLTFDAAGLTLAASSSSGIGDLISGALGSLTGSKITGDVSKGILGINSTYQSLLPRNIPTLATLALGVELYYSGWVFRGYFNSFGFGESVSNLGIFDYDIAFTVTQRRGYRTNYLPWHRNPSAPSDSDSTHLTFKK